jgi:hypothetical protein
MSFWAWLSYFANYTWLVLKTPVALTMWQHAYTYNSLLIIQETADTYGLLCLGLIFLSALIFARNSMFSVFMSPFTKSSPTDTPTDLKSNRTNRFKLLLPVTNAVTHLTLLLNRTLSSASARIRKFF